MYPRMVLDLKFKASAAVSGLELPAPTQLEQGLLLLLINMMRHTGEMVNLMDITSQVWHAFS